LGGDSAAQEEIAEIELEPILKISLGLLAADNFSIIATQDPNVMVRLIGGPL
jgi:hypothetical protein